MIRFIPHRQIEKEKWNRCIDESTNNLIYACSWYLDIASPGWNAIVLDDYAAVFPLTVKRKFGVNYLAQPFFCQQLGIFSSSGISFSSCREFLNAIPNNYKWIDIQLNNFYDGFLIDLAPRKKILPRFSYELSLAKSYAMIFENYSTDNKNNLKKAQQNHLLVQEVRADQVIHLYQKYISFKTPEIKTRDYQRLKCLMNESLSNEKAICIGAFDQNNSLHAAAFFLTHFQRIIFLFGGCSTQGRKTGAMRLLMDDVIKKHCGQNMVLDFEGSSVPSVEYFYKGFGAAKKYFIRYCYSQNSALEFMNNARMKRNSLLHLFNTIFIFNSTFHRG